MEIRSLKMAQQQGKKVAGGVNLKVNKEWMKEKAAEQVGKYGATRTREQAAEFEELCLERTGNGIDGDFEIMRVVWEGNVVRPEDVLRQLVREIGEGKVDVEGTLRGSAWSQWSKGDKAAKIPGKKDGAGGMSVIVLRDVVPEAIIRLVHSL